MSLLESVERLIAVKNDKEEVSMAAMDALSSHLERNNTTQNALGRNGEPISGSTVNSKIQAQDQRLRVRERNFEAALIGTLFRTNHARIRQIPDCYQFYHEDNTDVD